MRTAVGAGRSGAGRVGHGDFNRRRHTGAGARAVCAIRRYSILYLREFSRQSSFAHLNSITALRLDLCAGTLQIVCIAALAAGELLSAITVYATIGVANAVVALTWLSRSRNDFVVQRSQIFPVIRRNCHSVDGSSPDGSSSY